ncbi:MAG TPA: ATP-binding protein [Tepidisphaeraceae bacterium]|nr:ATP-binding protein [Tepidisphaeraceae bacterium]
MWMRRVFRIERMPDALRQLRARTIFVWAAGCLGAGAVCLAPDLLRIPHIAKWAGLHGWATAFFAVSAALSMGVVAMLRKQGDALTARLRQSELLSAKKIELPDTGFAFVSRAAGELLEAAERSVADAALRAKELTVQLRVATDQRQHAEAILHSISDAVLVTDPFDELVLANESAARMFAFELADAKRRPIGEVVRDPRVPELVREMRQANSRTGRRILEHVVQTPDGPRTYKLTLSTVAGGESDTPAGPTACAGVVAVLHDMTREKEVSEMKDDFVSMVSHELRTPLASIRAYVEMLLDGEASDRATQQEFYEVIANETARLSRLIDDILNLARIESGTTRVNKQPQSLTVILKDAIDVIAPQAKKKQITVNEKLTPVFYQTPADRDMLYQAVLNLLSNAVKYTPDGGAVTVETSVNESQKRVIARISDTGVGIPPKDLPFVFDKFYRAEANNRMAPGTGLGLSLVKHIVETVHHGRIFVESQMGKGTCFGFELDLCE